MSEQIIRETRSRMEKSEQNLRRELGKIRAGNANPTLLNHVQIDYYGVPTPINQLAQISVPEARQILVKPFDKNSLGDIERAINVSDLGIAPQNDGEQIRLSIPALTEERRKEIAKKVGEEAENAKISVRNIRRDSMDELKEAEKASEITEDELRRYEDQVQKVTDEAVKSIDAIAAEKEEEILAV